MTYLHQKRLRPFVRVAVTLLILIIVSIHVFGSFLLAQKVFGLFSSNNLIVFVLIGLFFTGIALFKFKHMAGLLHRKTTPHQAYPCLAISISPRLSHLHNRISSLRTRWICSVLAFVHRLLLLLPYIASSAYTFPQFTHFKRSANGL